MTMPVGGYESGVRIGRGSMQIGPALPFYDFTAGAYSGPSLTAVNASGGYVDDLAGNWTLIAPNTLRRSNKGLLIEEARTNSFLWSSNPTNAAWSKINASATALGTNGPLGDPSTALMETNANAEHYIRQTRTITAATENTFSWFVKANGRSFFNIRMIGQQTTGNGVYINTDLDAGTTSGAIALGAASSVGAGISPYANGWYRVWVKCKINDTDTGVICDVIMQQTNGGATAYVGDPTKGLEIAAPQLEQGSFPTSPIRTAGAAATRAADVVAANLTGLGLWPASAVALGAPMAPIPATAHQNLVQLDAGADAQRMVLRRQSSNGGVLAALAGGTGANMLPSGTWGQRARAGLAAAVEPGGQGASFNGGTLATGSAATLPTAPTTLRVGVNAGASEFWNGYIERVVLYPSRLPNAELQRLSQLSTWGG